MIKKFKIIPNNEIINAIDCCKFNCSLNIILEIHKIIILLIEDNKISEYESIKKLKMDVEIFDKWKQKPAISNFIKILFLFINIKFNLFKIFFSENKTKNRKNTEDIKFIKL